MENYQHGNTFSAQDYQSSKVFLQFNVDVGEMLYLELFKGIKLISVNSLDSVSYSAFQQGEKSSCRRQYFPIKK